VRVEEDPVLGAVVAQSDGGFDVSEVDPRVDVLDDLLDWELQLDLALLLEALPLLPVLQPLAEQLQLVRVHVAVVRTQRTAQVYRHDGFVRLQ